MGLSSYIKETKTEMSHVTWPKRRQVILYTVAVIIVSILVAVFLGLLDTVFSRLITLLF
jgi:preprotein translocase subunit SecE